MGFSRQEYWSGLPLPSPGRQYGDSLIKLGIKPPCDPTIPLLGIYPEDNKIEGDTCIPLHHYLQYLEHGSNLDVHQKMNG